MTHRSLSILLLGLIVALGIGIAPGSIASAAEAAPGEGLVVFKRKKSSKGVVIQFNIQQDGRPIGQLLSGTTIKIPLAPGRYIFYLFDGSGGETATGMPRSSVRVEIRSLDFDTWVAETYSSVDGQSIQVQYYRFTRR